MTRYTTPTETFTLPDDVDTSTLSGYEVVFMQDDVTLIKTQDDCTLDEQTISVTLTQEETASFSKGRCNVQIRGIYTDESVFATTIQQIYVHDVLNGEVMEL